MDLVDDENAAILSLLKEWGKKLLFFLLRHILVVSPTAAINENCCFATLPEIAPYTAHTHGTHGE